MFNYQDLLSWAIQVVSNVAAIMIAIVMHGSNDLSRAILSFLDAVTFNFKTNSQ